MAPGPPGNSGVSAQPMVSVEGGTLGPTRKASGQQAMEHLGTQLPLVPGIKLVNEPILAHMVGGELRSSGKQQG